MVMKYWWLMVGLAGAVACEAPPRSAPAAAEQYHYSPFVVQVSGTGMVFDTITFKDVGLSRDKSDPNDALFETIAESVSYEIQSTPEFGVSHSSVEYITEYSDANNHLSCETQHLYVDVWDRADHWGYSLWSGCGESDNFAWEEVAATGESDATLPESVAPLAGSITATLVHAHRNKCFVKKC